MYNKMETMQEQGQTNQPVSLKECKALWEKGLEEVAGIGDWLTVLTVLKKEEAYWCHRYMNLRVRHEGETMWDCSVDLQEVTAEQSLQWLVGAIKGIDGFRVGVLI